MTVRCLDQTLKSAGRRTVAFARIMIPRNVQKKLVLSDVLKPIPELYRNILHQNELATIFILLEVPAKCFPGNMKIEHILKYLNIKPSFILPKVN